MALLNKYNAEDILGDMIECTIAEVISKWQGIAKCFGWMISHKDALLDPDSQYVTSTLLYLLHRIYQNSM